MYLPAEHAQKVIDISKSFGVDAKVVPLLPCMPSAPATMFVLCRCQGSASAPKLALPPSSLEPRDHSTPKDFSLIPSVAHGLIYAMYARRSHGYMACTQPAVHGDVRVESVAEDALHTVQRPIVE